MILTREQIDAVTADAAFFGGDDRFPTGDLLDTARAYHALRDAVLAECEWYPDTSEAREAIRRVRAVVARVDGSGNGAGAVADGAP